MPRKILRRLKHLEPMAELRTQFIYNNHMYTVLGEVVTRVSGQPWEQFVAERIFRPLDMKSTTATVTEVPPDRLAPAPLAERCGDRRTRGLDHRAARRRPVLHRWRHGPVAQTATGRGHVRRPPATQAGDGPRNARLAVFRPHQVAAAGEHLCRPVSRQRTRLGRPGLPRP